MALFGRTLSRTSIRQLSRNLSFRAKAPQEGSRLTGVLTAVGLVGGAGLGYAAYHQLRRRDNEHFLQLPFNGHIVHAASKPLPQENVVSGGKDHALYLWIHLKPSADPKKCARAVAHIQKLVDTVSPPSMRDETDEVWAGVGFGSDFYAKLGKKSPEVYNYPHRKGALGELPSTGGDIFIHAKSNNVSKLFELAQAVQKELPAGSVEKFQDIYSFVYRNGRDLSGFIDGTENPADDDSRTRVAVNTSSGGSFCITQKWIHNHEAINGQKKSVLEGFVGRSQDDSTELKKKSATSHVARMTTGSDFNAPKKFEIVRQSMPYGTVGGDSGLFFIAFAASPLNFEYMLDRMTGTGTAKDGLSDDVMRMTRCVQGNYWYFPSKEELKALS